ncbi:MAG TPA: hypothetical protein VFB63_13605, partial [Bryobacteraceae bacterium]|jgi:hypothetical protein|nr:hypothetical protein [Bryobacteraceae bacterium]
MRIRLRFERGARVHYKYGKNRRVALAAASLLAPAAVGAFLLAVWRLAADMQYAEKFAISGGFFSHWHVWFAIAAILTLICIRLNRYGRGGPLF